THEDREKLLQIPIRRISQFDIDKNHEEISQLQETLQGIEKDLKNVKKFTIAYLKRLIEKYGKDFPRKTRIKSIEDIDRRAIETKQIKLSYDHKTGFVGTKVSGSIHFTCTNFDKLLIFFKDGSYKVTNIPEKQYVENASWVGVADKKTVMNVIYKNTETKQTWAKRFIIDKFILDKTYNYLDEKTELQYISSDVEPTVELQLVPKARQKLSKLSLPFKDVLVKGAQARGIRIASQEVKKVLHAL
ncbi:MAG: DNA topoisomerase IV subunit A, partial [Rhabdochlamydiaceae bacterium]